MGPSNTSSEARLSSLEKESEQFYSRFVRIGAWSISVVGVFAIVSGAATKQLVNVAAAVVVLVLCAVTFGLMRAGKDLLGRRAFIHGIAVVGLLSACFVPGREQVGIFAALAVFLVTLAGFALPRGDLLPLSLASLTMVVIVAVRRGLAEGWTLDAVANHGVTVGVVVMTQISVRLFTAHARGVQGQLKEHVDEIDRVMKSARLIAKGDLASTIDGDSEVSETIREMLEGLRTMVTRTREVTAALSSSAQEIAAMARQQEQGAVEQASAVTQVHKTLATLLDGSSHAAQSTEEVFRNVELTQKTSEMVAQRAAALSAHTRRISAILEIIKAIANKSEILALNAALEGARAGEAGRGFSLVASQMQRLAESVMDSVRDVRALVEDIEAATSATLAATEESTQLSTKATSATRQISATLRQQRGSTEQVAAAMQDIQQVAAQVSVGSTQSLSATRDLTRLANELTQAVEKFKL